MVWPFFSNDETENVASPKHREVTAPLDDEPEKTVEEALECDYERDCTTLYKKIENAMHESDFEPIVKFLDTGYWPGAFFADSIPASDQVRTWVTRFDTDDTQKVKWSQLPLHLAIVCNAPASVIGRLVKLYPQALRCTDDQHMLPLHLALRHNAEDEIIAFLLIRFPDAVNAKGKNGRSAVDCAMRAKDKLRGKILEIFVEKTKGKAASTLSKDNKLLKAEIEKKNDELDELKADIDAYRADLDNLKTLKNSIESDLLMKIQELEQSKAEMEDDMAERIERLKSEKLLHNLEVQKKMDELAASKRQLELAESKALEEEDSLRRELDSVQELVHKSVSPDDWSHLKKEVELLQAYRLKHTRSETKSKIETLKSELEQTMELTRRSEHQNVELKRTMESELNDLKNNIKNLEKSEMTARTSKDLLTLRNEVDQLKRELKERSEASRTKLELVVLKKAMETELKQAEGKTKEEIAQLKRAIMETNTEKLEHKTNDELNAMKTELEGIKSEMQQRELASKTRRDIEDLQETLQYKIYNTSTNKSKDEYEQMKQSVDDMYHAVMKSDGNDSDEMIAIKKRLENIKDHIKKKDTASKIVLEAALIKKSLEQELKNSEGKTQLELLKMKDAIKGLTEQTLANKDVNELSTIKSELNNVKEQLKIVEKVSKTHQELDQLKTSLAEEFKRSASRTEVELSAMKRAVDEINLEHQASRSLKQTLETEIKAASGKTEMELLDMKKAIDSIDLRQLEIRNKAEWEHMQNEIQSLKDELNQKKNLHALTTDKEIMEIKQVVNDLKSQQVSVRATDNAAPSDYFTELRQEMDALKADLKNKEDDENMLKREIEMLKEDGRKHRAGIKKFFSNRLNSWNQYPRLQGIESGDDGEATGDEGNTGALSRRGLSVYSSLRRADTTHSELVQTYRPPSLSKGEYAKRYKFVAASSSSSSEEGNVEAIAQGTPKEEPLVVIKRVRSNASHASKKSANSQKPPLPPSPSMQKGSSNIYATQSKDTVQSLLTNGSGSVQSRLSSKILVETVASSSTLDKGQPLSNASTPLARNSGVFSAEERRDDPPSSPSKSMSQESDGSKKSEKGGFLFKRMRTPPQKNNLFLRKVQSMGPTAASPSASASNNDGAEIKEAYKMTRQLSRAVIAENGDVEMETLDSTYE